MSERGDRLHATIDGQVAELIDLLSTADDAMLRRQCGAREKLGDGTVAANAWHTADNYQRIAEFVASSDHASRGHEPTARRPYCAPRLLRAIGHRPPSHGPEAASHDTGYTAVDIDVKAMLEQLTATRANVSRIGSLTDRQLDTIPPKGRFRFCDGQRTLEQVVSGLLNHQAHQLDALRAARVRGA